MALKHITNQLHPLSYYNVHNAQLPRMVCRGANIIRPHGTVVVQGFGNWIKKLSTLAEIVKHSQISGGEVVTPWRLREVSPGARFRSLQHGCWQAAGRARLTWVNGWLAPLLQSSPFGLKHGHKEERGSCSSLRDNQRSPVSSSANLGDNFSTFNASKIKIKKSKEQLNHISKWIACVSRYGLETFFPNGDEQSR